MDDTEDTSCCINCSEYKKIELTEVVQNDERHCTDIPCCLLLLSCIVLEIIICIYCSRVGANPLLLLHGTDYNGTLCDTDNPNGQYTVWPSLSYYDIRLCSHTCNTFTNNGENKLMIDHYESTLFMDIYCIPKASTTPTSMQTFDTLSQNFARGLADLNTTKWLILIMSFSAIILSFIYLKLISFIPRLLIVLSIFMVLSSGILISWLLLQNGVKDYNILETERIGIIEMIVALFIIILLLCFSLALCFSRKNIELVIDIFKEANYAIYDMKLTLIFPIWMSITGICYITYWIMETLYIYSIKVESTKQMPLQFVSNGGYPATYEDIQFDYDDMKRELIFHFIMLFYGTQVIIYYCYMVFAGVFADWYFSQWMYKGSKYKQRGDDIAELSTSPICESLWRITRYHIGSLAFGALVITIIRMIQWFVVYIGDKTSQSKHSIMKCIFAVVSCCLQCCECVFDRINKNGFIFTSIYGTSFCYSSYCACKLVLQNVDKTMIMTGVSKYTQYFGRFIISLLNTGIAALIIKYNAYYAQNLESYLFPSLCIFIVSYIVAALFMMVFDVAAQTIFLCFLVDESVHGVPRFATEEMKTLMSSATFLSHNGSDGNIQTYTHV